MKGGEKMANLKEIQKFFGMTATQFRSEWSPLSDADKLEIKQLVGTEVGK